MGFLRIRSDNYDNADYTGLSYPISFIDSVSDVTDKGDWAFEFSYRLYGKGSDARLFAIAGTNVGDIRGFTMTLLSDGGIKFRYGNVTTSTLVAVADVPLVGKIKFETDATGNRAYYNDELISLRYLTGNGSVNALTSLAPSNMGFYRELSGIVADATFYDTSAASLNWPMNDGAGGILTESIKGQSGAVTLPEWSDDYQFANVNISPFGHISDRIDQYTTPPSNELLCAYAEKDTGDPIYLSSGNWSSVAKDNIKRNPGLWMDHRPLTCASVWSDSSSSKWVAVLLSPRHVVLAKHVGVANGAEFLFLDENNNGQSTTLLDQTDIENDLTIGILADDITLDIEYAEIKSDSFNTAHNAYGLDDLGFPACGLTREGWLDVGEAVDVMRYGLPFDFTSNNWFKYSRFSIDATDRTGDSSRPSFIYNGAKLAYMFSNNFFSLVGGAVIGGTADPSYYKTEIKTVMDALDSAHSRTPNYELVISSI